MEKKTLKAARRVSDVERICQDNYERRKQEEQSATSPAAPRNDRETDCHGLRSRKDEEVQSVLHTAFTACMMAAGGCATFVGIGITMGRWDTVVLGTIMAGIFLLTGSRLEGRKRYG